MRKKYRNPRLSFLPKNKRRAPPDNLVEFGSDWPGKEAPDPEASKPRNKVPFGKACRYGTGYLS